MKKKLGFWSIVLLTINSIIGSGIFLSPGSVVTQAGTFAPLVYLSAAIFAALLGIVFAAAAKYVAHSGAAYAYAKAAFGQNVGFYIGITRYIAGSIAWGVMATAVIKTIISLGGGNNSNSLLITSCFGILMIVLLLVNFFGPRLFELINNLSTIGKLLALITTIIAGVFIIITTGANHFSSINQSTPPLTLSRFVMASIAAFYAFTGFESVASGSDDMDQPEKNLPRAIPFAIISVALIYIGIIIVSMMINPQALIKTKEVVALAAIFKNRSVQNIILVGALISMFGVNVAASFSTPRILEAMAQEKQVPAWFAKRSNHGFPLRAFVTTALIAIILPLSFNYQMTSIIILSSISRFIQFLIVPLCVIIFFYGKSKEATLPNVKKSFITDVICPIIALIMTILLLIKFDWVAQFTITAADGHLVPNIFAISAMIIGYFILPLMLFISNPKK
ncbi:APC family permease [Xylocopilactobacillus apicola]|uniref:Amino acid permease n=1 Tax=Xylocopilactobacillus apicola TaxID=2932184 RepID=A0AAU9CVL1_9LACO|nr:APC family permease [Xylocopilactobacillus apicola]BDR58019.1 amino acid permease [Xylocopilactobacillus apicola]